MTGSGAAAEGEHGVEGEVPPAGTPAWYEREGPLPGGRWRVRCLLGGDHPDGVVVEDPGDTSDLFELWRADVDDQGRPRLHVHPDAVPGAPAMWFVALPEPSATPRAMTLVGFDDPVVAPGTVIPDGAFFHLPVRSEDQVGAVRWWPDEAIVDQVFVGAAWRRRHVATAVIYAASAYHQLHGWPGRLHSDGRRTTLGEQLVAGLRHPDRIAPLEDLMPPMDEREPS